MKPSDRSGLAPESEPNGRRADVGSAPPVPLELCVRDRRPRSCDQLLRDVDLRVPAGQVVALLGPNGAGKTTLLRAATGLLGISAGEVRLAGADARSQRPHQRARAGLCLVGGAPRIFPNLNVRENLRLQVPPGRPSENYEPAARGFSRSSRSASRRRPALLSGAAADARAVSLLPLRPQLSHCSTEVSMGPGAAGDRRDLRGAAHAQAQGRRTTDR